MFTGDVSPDVTTVGPGEVRSAVVGSVHGDEPTGVRAIHRVLDASPTFDAAAKLVVANPPAAVAHRRYLDEDLNRVFPGDPDADSRERRLAAQLVAETADLPTLSIHTTRATSEPVAFVTAGKPRALELVARLPIAHVVNERPVVDSAFSSTDGLISVEVGHSERAAATEKAARIVRAFLRLTDTIAASGDAGGEAPASAPVDPDAPEVDLPPADADAEYFTSDRTVDKPADAESAELLAENFERVEAGAPYARVDGEDLVADEAFVPILVSETGYDEMFGYGGRKVADSLAGAREAWLDGDADAGDDADADGDAESDGE